MPRLLSPDDKCAQVDVRGRRYTGKVVDVNDPRAVRELKAVGYTQADASGGPARTNGYRCADCGFASYFRRCSRCGDNREQ